MQLLPCPDCGRHVRLEETACPFCRGPVGWKTTLAIALAGATLAGCPPRPAPKYGAPPPPPTAEVPAEESPQALSPEDNRPPEESRPPEENRAPEERGAPDDEVADEGEAPDEGREQPGEEMPDMRTLYGAPPEPESER